MRIPRTKVYRAFAELDAYDDARCERFVCAAAGVGLVSWGRRVFILLATLAMLFGALWGVVTLVQEVQGNRVAYAPWIERLAVLTVVPGVSVPVFVGLLLRDWLLRRRVARVLRRLGVCAGCGYGLVGLPVSDEHTVVCPECARVAKVDPSMGQLVRDAAGGARFAHGDVATKPEAFWTPSRRRIARRGAIVFLGLFVGLPGLALLVNEALVQWVAARATRDRMSQAGLDAWMERCGAERIAGRGRWGEVSRVYEIKIAIDGVVGQRGWFELEKANQDLAWPEMLGITRSPKGTPAEQQTMILRQALARELIAAYREGGLFDGTRVIAETPIEPFPMRVYASHPIWLVGMPELRSVRELSNALAARAALAIEARDLEEYVRADRELAAMVELQRSCPMGVLSIAARLGEQQRQGSMLRVLARVMGEGSEPALGMEWLDAVAAAHTAERGGARLEDVVAFERAAWQDYAAWGFESPRAIRFGSRSSGYDERFQDAQMMFSLGGIATRRLGSYGENVREGRAIWDDWEARALVEPWQRASPTARPRPTLLLTTMANFDPYLREGDREIAWRRGVEAMIAIARFHGASGRLPASLAELVPRYLPGVPVDPWTGRGLVYRLVEPDAVDSGRLGFVLYAVGEDELDEGGIPEEFQPAALIGGSGAGSEGDMVVYPIRE